MFDLFYILKCIFLISYSKIWICIFQILPNGFKEQGRKEGRGSWCIKDWEQQVCHFNLKVKILNQKIFKFLSFTMFHNVLQSFSFCNVLQCFGMICKVLQCFEKFCNVLLQGFFKVSK